MSAAQNMSPNLPGGYKDVVEFFSSDLVIDSRMTKERLVSSGHIPLRVVDGILYIGVVDGKEDLSVIDQMRAQIDRGGNVTRNLKTKEVAIIRTELEIMLNRAFPVRGETNLAQASAPSRESFGLILGREGANQDRTMDEDEALEMRDIDASKVWELDRKNKDNKRVYTDKSGVEKELEPARSLLYLTIAEAVRAKATDIHIEATDSKLRVRYRIDGELVEATQVPVALRKAFIAAVKVNSTIDAGAPMGFESGRAAIKTGGKVYDLRIEKNPSSKGQELVIRILDKEADWRLDTLNFSRENLAKLKQALRTPYGLILITGPTGSGKSTTLFAMLSELARPGNKKILTIENPVEYEIKGANQVNVSEKQKQTFASALRSFLRQDPDIIMVGETRDAEVATIAAQAAETGHLVFTTLHTNDSASSFPRLTGMELRMDLMLSSVEVVLAQRLVKRVNPIAWEMQTGLASEMIGPLWVQSGLPDMEVTVPVKPRDFKNEPLPAGYTETPPLYKGRMPIHEVLMATPEIKEMVKNGAIHMEIKKKAREQGMLTMFQDGLLKVGEGVISMDSLLAQAKPDDGYVMEESNMGLGRWSLQVL